MPQKSTLNKQNKNVTSWTAFFLMKKAVLFETFCKYTQFCVISYNYFKLEKHRT